MLTILTIVIIVMLLTGWAESSNTGEVVVELLVSIIAYGLLASGLLFIILVVRGL